MSDALVGTDGLSTTSLLVIGAIIVVVIGLIVWRLRRRGHMAFIRGGSNRQPRLAVLDAAAVDARRRLVLVRRDNVEHLIMIGGPSDIVVERGINRVAAAPRPGTETTVALAPTPPLAEAVHQAAPKGQLQPAQPQVPQRSEPPHPAIPQPEVIATELQNNPNSNPPKKRGRQPKADTSPDMKRAAHSPPAEAEPLSPAQTEAKPTPQSANAGPTAQRPGKPPTPPSELAVVAVSAAAASAADQMAKLDEGGQDGETGKPVAEAKGPDADAKNPVVEEQTAAVATATIPDEENIITAELDDVQGAVRALVMPEETKTEPKIEETIPSPQVDLEPPISDVPVVGAADARETGKAVQPNPMTAEELIADFDELLEAEISRAEQQKDRSGPEHPTPPGAGIDVKRSAGVPSASLEDEMKKLLGDLNVKQ